MRGFIQEQEMKGNQVKLAHLDNKFAICFQRQKEGELKPHFFVYEILKR